MLGLTEVKWIDGRCTTASYLVVAELQGKPLGVRQLETNEFRLHFYETGDFWGFDLENDDFKWHTKRSDYESVCCDKKKLQHLLDLLRKRRGVQALPARTVFNQFVQAQEPEDSDPENDSESE